MRLSLCCHCVRVGAAAYAGGMPAHEDRALLPRTLWRPRPKTSAELHAFIHDILRHGGVPERDLRRLHIDGSIDGADIPSLSISTRDAAFRFAPEADPETAPEISAATVTTGVLGRLSVVLERITVEKAPLSLIATATEVPLAWLEADGLVMGFDGVKTWRGRATVSVDTDLDKLAKAAREAANSSGEVTVTKLAVSGTSQSDRSADVRVAVGARKGFLAFSGAATAHVEIDESLTVRVSNLKITSRNPIVAIAARAFRRKIREAVEGEHTMAELVGPAIEVTDVRMRFGPSFSAEIAVRGTGVASA